MLTLKSPKTLKITPLPYLLVMNQLANCLYHISCIFQRTLVLSPTQDRPVYGAAAFKMQLFTSD